MYKIIFNNSVVGTSQLEVGYPPTGCVSGIIEDINNIKEFSFFILLCGGTESDEAYRLKLTDKFLVVSDDSSAVPYSGGCILWYPALNEAVIDLVGIPYLEYERLFPDHVARYEKQL